MMVERENAKNEQYIFQYNDNPFSEVITYKKPVSYTHLTLPTIA